MSEGHETNWRCLPRLLTLLGILLSVGVSFGAMEAQRGELGWFVALPFAAGLAFGDMMPKRNRFEPMTVALAPLASIFAVGIILVVTVTCHAVVQPNPDTAAPYVVQGLAGAAFGIPGLIVGSIPAIIGALISSSLKSPGIL
jgi:hypothetical protein